MALFVRFLFPKVTVYTINWSMNLKNCRWQKPQMLTTTGEGPFQVPSLEAERPGLRIEDTFLRRLCEQTGRSQTWKTQQLVGENLILLRNAVDPVIYTKYSTFIIKHMDSNGNKLSMEELNWASWSTQLRSDDDDDDDDFARDQQSHPWIV